MASVFVNSAMTEHAESSAFHLSNYFMTSAHFASSIPRSLSTLEAPTTMADKAETKDDTIDDTDILEELERESKEWNKDTEIDRIMQAFKLNAYEVLDLLPGVPDKDIKICYRKKSLLIHPDKTKNSQAPDAFDRLKKAESDLMDEKKRKFLDEAISDARELIMREKKWNVDSDELKTEWFLRELWPQKTKHVLVEAELRKQRQRKAQMREEGRQQRKEDEEIAERKRKREAEQRWDDSRENRVNSWRDFQKAGAPSIKGGANVGADVGANGEEGKKKKKKMKVLG